MQFNQGRKLLSTGNPARVKAHLFVRFTVGNAPVLHPRGVVGFFALGLES